MRRITHGGEAGLAVCKTVAPARDRGTLTAADSGARPFALAFEGSRGRGVKKVPRPARRTPRRRRSVLVGACHIQPDDLTLGDLLNRIRLTMPGGCSDPLPNFARVLGEIPLDDGQREGREDRARGLAFQQEFERGLEKMFRCGAGGRVAIEIL